MIKLAPRPLQEHRSTVFKFIPHLYLHIPFCHRICPYCSFYKHQPGSVGGVGEVPGFLQAVLRETRQVMKDWHPRFALKTVYWGGGTPSLVSTEHLAAFLPQWLEILGRPNLEEWTVEMNPMTLTADKLAVFKNHGVTRASLGVQSWDPTILATLGRDHSPEQALRAYDLLRNADFSAVGIDHMFSVPGQSAESWRATLQQTIDLKPDHLSCYNLTYEEDTAFFESLQQGFYQKDAEMDAGHFGIAVEMLENAGYLHYETSNYARPGFESRHNMAYWRGGEYVGLGPSAVSTVGHIRWKNKADTRIYTALAGHSSALQEDLEKLTPAQWRCERLALELRMASGVDLEIVGAEAQDRLATLVEEGLVEISEGRVKTTARGKFVVDSVAEYLL